jgi:hypothetical protein
MAAYLSTTSSVLGSTTGNQLSILGHKLLIETHVLLLGEDGIVVLETVLLEKGGITLHKDQQPNGLFIGHRSQFVPTSLDV